METRGSAGGADGAPPPRTQTAPVAEAERQRRARLAAELHEPPRAPQEEGAPPPAGSVPRLRTAAAVLAVAVAVGAYFWSGGGNVDRVPDQDKIAWAAAWAAAPPTRLTLVPAEELPEALAAMSLPPQQAQQLQDELAAGRTRLVWLTFTDTLVEDGDRVQVESGPYVAEITLRKTPTRVYVPEPPGGVVNVTGTHDGGGGITLGVASGDRPVNLPFMEVGETVGIPTVTVP